MTTTPTMTELTELTDAEVLLASAALLDDMGDIVIWAYRKLHHVNFNDQDDALMLERMKMLAAVSGYRTPDGIGAPASELAQAEGKTT